MGPKSAFTAAKAYMFALFTTPTKGMSRLSITLFLPLIEEFTLIVASWICIGIQSQLILPEFIYLPRFL